MATTIRGISVDEYLHTSYEPDYEYVDGEVIERNMGELDHAGLQGFPEARVQVAPTRFRVPDIAVTTHKPRGPILRQPPFLCIEILSPEDRVSRVNVKIDDYLKFGVSYVWLIDPRERLAWSYRREGSRESTSILIADNHA